MTPIEMAACNEAMIDVIGRLPEDLWIIDQKIKAPMGRNGRIMEIYVSGTHGCGVDGAARALGVEYMSMWKDGFLERSFELDGVKVFQLTAVDE